MSQHSIVHLDIPATDPAAASKFYTDLFDWKLQVDPTFNEPPQESPAFRHGEEWGVPYLGQGLVYPFTQYTVFDNCVNIC